MLCTHCGQNTARYSIEHHRYECTSCGHVEMVEPELTLCPGCRKPLVRWTWFDPSGCPMCHYSFVD